jgi:hypothetical protein
VYTHKCIHKRTRERRHCDHVGNLLVQASDLLMSDTPTYLPTHTNTHPYTPYTHMDTLQLTCTHTLYAPTHKLQLQHADRRAHTQRSCSARSESGCRAWCCAQPSSLDSRERLPKTTASLSGAHLCLNLCLAVRVLVQSHARHSPRVLATHLCTRRVWACSAAGSSRNGASSARECSRTRMRKALRQPS